jgi:3-methyladenine DNA glycosylase/8-oxoguanine DNA glycosylase
MSRHNLSLSQLSDTVLRNDERLKVVINEQENIKKSFSSLEEKTQKLEIKVESASMRIGSHDAKWSTIMDMVWKCALMIIAGYILYALGLQADLAFPPP